MIDPLNLPATLMRELEEESSVALVLDTTLHIRHVNGAWGAAALRDGASAFVSSGSVLGRAYLDFVVGPLRAILEARLLQTLAENASAKGLLIQSECNSPTHFRTLTSHLLPLRLSTDAVAPEGVLILHSLQVRGLLSDRERLAEESHELWRTSEGILIQCSCCRRARDARTGTWRMNPSLVATPLPNTSHGLCGVCLEAYYPEG